MVSRAIRIVLAPIRLLLALNDVVRRDGAARRIGRCPGCGCSVFADDPHVRYHGDVFHAEPCVEICAYVMSGLARHD